VIDEATNAVVDTLTKLMGPLGQLGPQGIAYDSSTGCLFVANSGTNNVSLIYTTGIAANISVGPNPVALTFDQANGYVYVTDYGGPTYPNTSNLVSVIDGFTNRIITNMTVGTHPDAVASIPRMVTYMWQILVQTLSR
jgi:YVTN family beta-propeller protein